MVCDELQYEADTFDEEPSGYNANHFVEDDTLHRKYGKKESEEER